MQAGQASRVAEDLLRRTRKNREQLSRLLQREVKRQLGAVGIATREEVARLQQRVRALEQAAERASRPAGGRTRAASSRAQTPRTSPRSPGGTRRGRGTTKATGTGPGGVTESTATPSNAHITCLVTNRYGCWKRSSARTARASSRRVATVVSSSTPLDSPAPRVGGEHGGDRVGEPGDLPSDEPHQLQDVIERPIVGRVDQAGDHADTDREGTDAHEDIDDWLETARGS